MAAGDVLAPRVGALSRGNANQSYRARPRRVNPESPRPRHAQNPLHRLQRVADADNAFSEQAAP